MLNCVLGDQVQVLQPRPLGRTDRHRLCVAGGDDSSCGVSVPGSSGGRGVPTTADGQVQTQAWIGQFSRGGHTTEANL